MNSSICLLLYLYLSLCWGFTIEQPAKRKNLFDPNSYRTPNFQIEVLKVTFIIILFITYILDIISPKWNWLCHEGIRSRYISPWINIQIIFKTKIVMKFIVIHIVGRNNYSKLLNVTPLLLNVVLTKLCCEV